MRGLSRPVRRWFTASARGGLLCWTAPGECCFCRLQALRAPALLRGTARPGGARGPRVALPRRILRRAWADRSAEQRPFSSRARVLENTDTMGAPTCERIVHFSACREVMSIFCTVCDVFCTIVADIHDAHDIGCHCVHVTRSSQVESGRTSTGLVVATVLAARWKRKGYAYSGRRLKSGAILALKRWARIEALLRHRTPGEEMIGERQATVCGAQANTGPAPGADQIRLRVFAWDTQQYRFARRRDDQRGRRQRRPRGRSPAFAGRTGATVSPVAVRARPGRAFFAVMANRAGAYTLLARRPGPARPESKARNGIVVEGDARERAVRAGPG